MLMHNLSDTQNHWVGLDLRAASPNRYAYGAQLHARVGTQTWIGQVSPASSYLSSSDPRIHWGIGSLQKLDEVTIRWPNGQQETLHDVPCDHYLTVVEGKGIVH